MAEPGTPHHNRQQLDIALRQSLARLRTSDDPYENAQNLRRVVANILRWMVGDDQDTGHPAAEARTPTEASNATNLRQVADQAITRLTEIADGSFRNNNERDQAIKDEARFIRAGLRLLLSRFDAPE